MNDVFISYISIDRPWSEWIAWVLEENGYTVTAQALDDRSGESLVSNVQQAIAQPGFTLIVLSENYITVADNQPDGPLNLPQDPTLTPRRVIPIRVETCQLPQNWELSEYIDLVDQAETEAEQTILAALKTHSESEASPPKPAESSINIPLGTAQAEGLPVELGQTQTLDKSNGSQLKLRRRSKTVHGYVERLTDDIGLEMMQIPAGSFLMGSPEEALLNDGMN